MMKDIEKEIREALPKIGPDFHKYDRGRLLCVAGSYGMAGALIMAARAALRTGAGYLDCFVPAPIYGIAAGALPEAVFCVYDPDQPEAASEKLSERIEKADAVLFGPGLGVAAKGFLPAVLASDKPVLIDADGLNALAAMTEVPGLSRRDAVLTPHMGEARRLIPEADDDALSRASFAGRLYEKYGCTVLLKGPDTIVRSGTETYVNPTGNAALARAGSGDVLSGIIASLMAQGEDSFTAAVSGAYLHGKAAEILCGRLGMRSVLPTDIIGVLPELLRQIEN